MKSSLEHIELNELIEKLKKNGCKELVEALMNNEGESFTKRFRLNKSGACRVLGWKTKQLEDMLLKAKEILEKDFAEV